MPDTPLHQERHVSLAERRVDTSRAPPSICGQRMGRMWCSAGQRKILNSQWQSAAIASGPGVCALSACRAGRVKHKRMHAGALHRIAIDSICVAPQELELEDLPMGAGCSCPSAPAYRIPCCQLASCRAAAA